MGYTAIEKCRLGLLCVLALLCLTSCDQLNSMFDPPKPVGLISVSQPPGKGNLEGMAFSNAGTHFCPLVLADQARTDGKWYYEVRFRAAADTDKPMSFTRFGLLWTTHKSSATGMTSMSEPYFFSPHELRRELRDGGVVGVAMNLDDDKLYFAVDGKWIGAHPGQTDGIQLDPELEYLPAATACGKKGRPDLAETWIFNFGREPFLFAPPHGFDAYDRSGSARQARDRDGEKPPEARKAAVADERPQAPPSTAVADERPQAPPSTAVDGWAPMPEFSSDTKVHYVGVYESDAVRLDNGAYENGIAIHVKDTRGPVVVVLCAYRPQVWTITWDQGVRLAGVIIGGKDQRYRIQDESVSVTGNLRINGRMVKLPSHISDKTGFIKVNKAVKALTGLEVSEVQSAYKGKSFVLDKGRTMRFTSVATVTDEPVYLKGRVSDYTGQSSSLGLTFANEGTHFCPLAYASEARNTGKWYYEAHFQSMAYEEEPKQYTRFGLLWASFGGLRSGMIGMGEPYFMPGKVMRGRLRHGGVVGVAMDLDAKRLHFAIDGEWVVGDPADAMDGVTLEAQYDYLPAATVCGDDGAAGASEVWYFNFGSKPFRFRPPQGYASYDQSPGSLAVRNKDATSKDTPVPARKKPPASQAVPPETYLESFPDGAVAHYLSIADPAPRKMGGGGYDKAVRVHVTAIGPPVVLVLTANRDVVWDVSWDKGVDMAGVVLGARGGQRFRIQDAAVPVGMARNRRFGRVYVPEPKGARKAAEEVRQTLGVDMGSFKFGHKVNEMVVDGSSTVPFR